jgi:hypothetical protein
MRCRPDARPETYRVNENRVPGRNLLGLGTALRAIAGLFSRTRRSSQDEIQMADQRLWTFDWPEEVLAREVVARTEDFAAWLREHGWRELTRRQLISRYWEFIEITETRPLTGWGRFDRSLRGAGIQRVRSTVGAREYGYRLAPARPKLVSRSDTRDPALGERSVA